MPPPAQANGLRWEGEISVDQPRTKSHTPLKSSTLLWFQAVVFGGLFLLVFLLQHLSGAYGSEFGGYPDEPAHYVTSLMVRDFVLGGNYRAPLEFAGSYYKHYPKVAFGHWPPLLYVVQGFWMILFSGSRTSVLVELALTTALAAFLLFRIAAKHYGKWAGIGIAVLLVCLPDVQISSNEEMAESLLLVTTFGAAIFFYRYLERHRWQDSLWFAVFCSLAILTKGNGWALAIIPPVAIVLTRDWRVLKRPSFWIPVPVVALLCLPWQVMTIEMARRGWTAGTTPTLQYTLQALGQFLLITRDMLGWGITILAAWGIWIRVIAPARSRPVAPLHAVMFGLFVSMWVFHSVVPAGVESRKMVNALPALLLFALAGAGSLAGLIWSKFAPNKLSPAWPFASVAGLAALLFAVETFVIPTEQHYGFTELAGYIETRPELRNAVILVSSERDGEGLLISELAMQDARPAHTILRANKVLSTSDWNGNVSDQFCNTAGDVMQLLKREHVRAVVLDTFPRRIRYRHHELILQAIRAYPDAWQLKSAFGDGKIQLYELKQG